MAQKSYRMIPPTDRAHPPVCEVGSTSFYRFENREQVERWLAAMAEERTVRPSDGEVGQ
jgi:hypothetical protein